MIHQIRRSSSPAWRNSLSLGILLFGACVTLMITEVDSLRYIVVCDGGVSYRKSPDDVIVHSHRNPDLKKGTAICATPVGEDSDWVKVPGKGYLPIRRRGLVQNRINLLVPGTVEVLKEFHGVEVTGAGLESLNGFYVRREADHYRGPSFYGDVRKSDWDIINGGRRWYETHDRNFIRFDPNINGWSICPKGGFNQYVSPSLSEYPPSRSDDPPTTKWELALQLAPLCETCRGRPDLTDETVAKDACSTKATHHNWYNWGHVHTKVCPECHGSGNASSAVPTLVVS